MGDEKSNSPWKKSKHDAIMNEGLTAESFPAHLHSSLLEGVAGHAICANRRKTNSH